MSACGPSVVDVITCVVHYTIDPDQIAAFEQFARAWMRHVDEHGGTHHGYYLPAEGVSDRAEGAVANFRRRAVTTQSSSSDARCGSAFSGSLEHPADDHRIRLRLPVGKHRALAFP
ncbi:NIPSNAP family protein [Corynebacterium kefirresidentii]|uniref:NIPSNAP family protein n=1 Tax=Corynebacterium kefirresidentii TaxID=1979527 RepID=UPI0038CF92EE